MHSPICTTCCTQFAPCAHLPSRCAVCDDGRRHEGWDGQQWTTHEGCPMAVEAPGPCPC